MTSIIANATRLLAAVAVYLLALADGVPAQSMRVHFIDVGQGASTLVEFPCAAIIIDAGGETNPEFKSDDELVAYLDDFFGRRADLNRTFHSLILTHPHVDHTHGVAALLSRYKIRNAITNGQEPPGPGLPGQKALHQKVADAEEANDPAAAIGFVPANVKKIRKNRGQTNEVIDPVKCDTVDPKITLLWGTSDENPGWTKRAFENQNNHSVVTRIDFGAASLLVTGDLQEEAINDLIEHYRGSTLLDVDVYHVGHHGSHNATTEGLLEAITPKIAVIAMGVPTRELTFTAWAHGHPRKDIVELLEGHVAQSRDPITVDVATTVRKFESKRITRAIYATGWDGSVVLETDTAGNWKTVKRASPAAAGGPSASAQNLVNINTATVEELTALPRIGFTRAKAVVDHRAAQGAFRSIDDLAEVKGIGPATVIAIRKLVTVGN